MGDVMLGGSKGSQMELMTPEQRQFLSQAGGGYQQFLQPTSMEDYQKLFQQSYIDPAMMAYKQQILPGIGQQFSDVGAGSSSALNLALASSAKDLATGLGGQMGNFYQEMQKNKLLASQGLGGLAGDETTAAELRAALLGVFGGVTIRLTNTFW